MPLYPRPLQYHRAPSVYLTSLELDGATRTDLLSPAEAKQSLHLYEAGAWSIARITVEVTSHGPTRPGDRAIAVALAGATRQRWAIGLHEASPGRWEGTLELDAETTRGSVQVVAELVASSAGERNRVAPPGLPAAVLYVDPPRSPLGRSLTPVWVDFVDQSDRLGLAGLHERDLRALVSHVTESSTGYRWYWNLANDAWKRVMYPRRAGAGLKDLRIYLFELDAEKTMRQIVLSTVPSMIIEAIESEEGPSEDELGIALPIVDFALRKSGYSGSTFAERFRDLTDQVTAEGGGSMAIRQSASRRSEYLASRVAPAAYRHRPGVSAPLPEIIDRLRHQAISRPDGAVEQ